MIEINSIFKKYGNKSVLNGVSAHFEKGKTYGIVGENGAGKTTLFRCIAGLESYEGTISSDLQPLKHHLGLLTSDPYFLSKITGEEYLHLMTDARGRQLKNIIEHNIFDLPLKEYASNYSTGMKKKLALTAVLLQGNEYFILDEPYNGIDLQSSIMLTEIIHKLRNLRKSVIVSSHIFSTLKDTCDEILLLENGTFTKIVQKDDFDLLEEEMKSRVIHAQLERLFESE